MGRSSWILEVGSTHNHKCPCKGRWAEEISGTRREGSVTPEATTESVVGPQAKEHQEHQHLSIEEARDCFSSRASLRDCGSANTLIFMQLQLVSACFLICGTVRE